MPPQSTFIMLQYRKWTQDYAKNPLEVNKEKVKRLTDMGFPEAKVAEVLAKVGYDEEAAVNILISQQPS